MDTVKAAKDCIKHLKIRASGSGNPLTDNNPTSFTLKKFQDELNDCEALRDIALEAFKNKTHGDIFQEIRKILREQSRQKSLPRGLGIDLDKIIIGENVRQRSNKGNKLLLDKDSLEPVLEFTYEYLESAIGGIGEVRKLLGNHMAPVNFIFNPMAESFEPVKVKCAYGYYTDVNLFRPEPWFFEEKHKDAKEGPALYMEYMEHFIPDKAQRYLVEQWMCASLVSRNETYLVLHSGVGTGKNILCAEIMTRLHGREYSVPAQGSLATTNFDSVLGGKRFVYWDEQDWSGLATVDKLKKYANRFVTLEKKGIDVDKPTELFCSQVIMNNNLYHNRIEPSGNRRFGMPKLSEHNLKDTMGTEKIKEFIKALDSGHGYISHIGFYLLNKYKDTFKSPHDLPVIKSETYYKAQECNLPNKTYGVLQALKQKAMENEQEVVLNSLTPLIVDAVNERANDSDENRFKEIDITKFSLNPKTISSELLKVFKYGPNEVKIGTMEGNQNMAKILLTNEFIESVQEGEK